MGEKPPENPGHLELLVDSRHEHDGYGMPAERTVVVGGSKLLQTLPAKQTDGNPAILPDVLASELRYGSSVSKYDVLFRKSPVE